MSVTIYDIAKKAQVSHATVSRALNNHKNVNRYTRKHILDLAGKLGYRPSYVGKSLVTGKTSTIGLVLPDLSNPFYIEFLRVIEQGCMQRGYRVIALEYALDAERERMCMEEMMKGRCDGVVAVIVRFDHVRDLLEEMWGRRFPCYIDGLPFSEKEINVKVDGSIIHLDKGYARAIEHLVSYGHKRIGFIRSIPPEAGDPGRHIGLERGFAELGIENTSVVYSRFSGDHIKDGRDAMADLLREESDITAVICSNDMVAYGAIKTLRSCGLRCPEDISIIGDNNTWLASDGYIPLTSIDQNTSATAKSAVKTIFERLNNPEWAKPKHEHFNSSLIVRESTGPVRG